MNFYFPNDSFSLENLLARKINQKNFTDSEKYIVTYVQNWFDGLQTFTFQTSGSTGKPKTIQLAREQLAYSASSTLSYLYPTSVPKSLLLCLNPKLIGGTQVITRAILSGANLVYREPSSNPLRDISEHIDIASMVPLQIKTILQEDPNLFEKVGTILIGGASLDEKTSKNLENKKTLFFQTFGMTETASNVALKALVSDHYVFIGDVMPSIDERGCLALCGTVTKGTLLQTNDIVELVENGLVWKGRADWVINSGGVKIHPEEVERKIQNQFPDTEVYITKVEDQILGEKVILCSLSPILNSISESEILNKYELPKAELILEKIPRTPTGKINRLELHKIAANRIRESQS